MRELFIDTPEQLQEFSAEIKSSPWLALDTEFIREKTYYSRLCLLQVSNGNVAACIDPLALVDLGPLLEVLFDENITKVFHAAGQDLEIFSNLWDRLPCPLFDTQPAAALLGYGEQIGYAGLINNSLGIDLPKNHSRTDWSRRPLGKGQLRYALDDVIYLGQAYEKMLQQLQKMGRLDWLKTDFDKLSDKNNYIPDPLSMWKKVKGRQHLKGVKLAALQQLAAWREKQAIKKNLPRRWVLKDEVMIDLARHMPQDLDRMSAIRGLEPNALKRHGNDWLTLLKQAAQLPKEQWPNDTQRAGKLTQKQEIMCDLLQCGLRLLAAEQNMSPAAIAGKKQLEALIRGETNTPLLQGWRKTVAGNSLLELLQGQRQIRVENGCVTWS